MKQCPRCGHWHHGVDSNTCDKCWEELGQMTFWEDPDEDYEPPIDTVFDRQEEDRQARGYQ